MQKHEGFERVGCQFKECNEGQPRPLSPSFSLVCMSALFEPKVSRLIPEVKEPPTNEDSFNELLPPANLPFFENRFFCGREAVTLITTAIVAESADRDQEYWKSEQRISNHIDVCTPNNFKYYHVRKINILSISYEHCISRASNGLSTAERRPSASIIRILWPLSTALLHCLRSKGSTTRCSSGTRERSTEEKRPSASITRILRQLFTCLHYLYHGPGVTVS